MTHELLKKATLTQVSEINLNNGEDSLTIRLVLPISDTGVTSYEETITFGRNTPKYLREAARKFSEAALRAVQERVTEQDPSDIRCGTCTSACCHHYDAVRVTREDVLRFHRGGLDINYAVNFYAEESEGEGSSWTGHVGQMAYTDLNFVEAKGCVYVGANGCQIYDLRPAICREYSARTCGDVYEKDDKKVELIQLGKRTLKEEHST